MKNFEPTIAIFGELLIFIVFFLIVVTLGRRKK
jgi:hypothetical protein